MAERGRPKTPINLEDAEKLGSINCTLAECSAWMGIPVSTLSTRPDFSDAYKRGKERGKISLRRLMFQHAETSPAMAIFLSKNLLGYRDQPVAEDDDVGFELIDNWDKKS